jgi:hypothetical protein
VVTKKRAFDGKSFLSYCRTVVVTTIVEKLSFSAFFRYLVFGHAGMVGMVK